MGMSYFIFMEAMVDNQWACMNHTREGRCGKCLVPVYESGSRSCFGNAFSKLQELGECQADWDTLSGEVKEFIGGSQIPEGWMACVIPESRLWEALPPGGMHEHNDYVLKDDIFAYESQGEEIESWITAEEYRGFEEEERKPYQYYEWDDPYGYVTYFRKILEHAGWIKWEFSCADCGTEGIPVRFVAIAC